MDRLFNRILFNKLKRIKLVVFDVDGVLTDGGLWIDSQGGLLKRFDVKDGLGIRFLQSAKIKIAIISGGVAESTNQRAKQLGIEFCLVGVKDKSFALKKLKKDLQIRKEETLFLGDDLNDLVIRNDAEILVAVKNASLELRKRSDIVLKRKGGYGAVRELSEAILRSKGLWDKIAEKGWKDIN